MTSRKLVWAVLAAAVGLSLWLNFRGLGWGIVVAPNGGAMPLHPDEDVNVAAVRHSLPKGGLLFWQEDDGVWPYYLKGQFYYTELRLLAQASSPWLSPVSRAYYLLCRSLTAVQGVLCVLLAAALGWRILGPELGVLAALLLAVCPGLAAHSHYMTQDVPLTFWSLAALLLCVEIRGGRRGAAAAAGLGASVALAVATKHSGWILLLPAVIAGRALDGRGRAAAAAAFLLILGLADPILWSEPALVRHAAGLLAENNRKGLEYKFARLPGWLDYAVSVLPYAMGAPLALFSLAGLPALWKRPEARLLLVWAAAYWVLLGFDNARLVRYTVPVLPVLCLSSAALAGFLWRRGQGFLAAATGLAAYAFLTALLTAAAYTGAMRLPDPRYQAYVWFSREVPAPARVAVPRVNFASLPTPPGGTVKEVGFDWQALMDSGADYFVFSDFDWLPLEESADYFPQEAGFMARVEKGPEFRKVAQFHNPMSFLGYWPSKGWPPHDWLYPDATLNVYRRVSAARASVKARPS